MNKLSYIFLFFIILLLNGCVSVTQELPPFTTYSILLQQKYKIPTSTNKTKQYSIEVLEPKALNSVNSKLISYSTTSYQNETYALNKWSDNPTKLIQNIMVQYLNKTDQYKFITSSKLNINTTYKLMSELDTFGQVFKDGQSYGKLDIRVYLVDYKSIHTKRFKYLEKCDENNAYGSVKALNHISNQFVQDLHTWIQKSL